MEVKMVLRVMVMVLLLHDVDGIENWSYRGLAGPQFWSNEYPMCGGKRQSPINIATAEVKGQYPWTPLRVKDYGKTPKSMTLKNTGHTALVTIVQHPNPSILGGDLSGTYAFVQFQFHWGTNDTSGSEHTIDGNRFQGELHLVHYKTAYGSLVKAMNHEDGLAVLAIFLSVGPEHNPKFNKLFKGLAKVHYADTQKRIKPFPLKRLLPTFVNTFYRYKGSMTYPPCLENTVWTIFKDPVTISANQLTRFRKLTDDQGKPLKSNFRPLQPGSLMVMGGREAPFWLYHGKQGPKQWSVFFPKCGGSFQSPINIVRQSAIYSSNLQPFLFENYDHIPKTTTLKNNGHSAQVFVTMSKGVPSPSVTGGGLQGEYSLIQYHFHWGRKNTKGSEHTINGVRYPGELHLVHFNNKYETPQAATEQSDGFAVLALLFKISKEDNLILRAIIDGLTYVQDADTSTVIRNIPLEFLLPPKIQEAKFYRYRGSFTTPGCDETVVWTIFKKTIPISLAQIAKFRKMKEANGKHIKRNFRPVQLLNSRTVYASEKVVGH